MASPIMQGSCEYPTGAVLSIHKLCLAMLSVTFPQEDQQLAGIAVYEASCGDSTKVCAYVCGRVPGVCIRVCASSHVNQMNRSRCSKYQCRSARRHCQTFIFVSDPGAPAVDISWKAGGPYCWPAAREDVNGRGERSSGEQNCNDVECGW